MQNIEFFIDARKEKKENMFKYLYELFLQNKSNTFYGISSIMIIMTFLNYNNNFNSNKVLILKHVDYVYEKTEENLNYTKTLIEAEKTFFNRMCGYYETVSNHECTRTQNILKDDK